MESAPSIDHSKPLPKVEQQPKQLSQGETKAQELLSHIPELGAEESEKLGQAFAQHLDKKFSNPNQRRLILEAKVATPEEAQQLWNIVSEGPKADFAQKMLKFTVDRVKVEPLVDNSKFNFTEEELEKGLSSIDKLEEKFYMIDKRIPMEQKREVVDQTFEAWRDTLKKVPDATLFASSAMYLWGKHMKQRGETDEEIPKDFTEIPGDLDAFVKDKESLFKMKDELSQIPGIVFDNNGEPKRYADGTLAISGYRPIKVNVGGREQVYNHDFEFFTSDTNRILQGATKRTESLDGIHVLSLEGLKTQYANNLAFESRVKRETQSVTDFLAAIGDRPLTERESKKLELSQEEVAEFQKLQAEFWEEIRSSQYSASKITESMTKLLSGGLKEKVAKRLRNVEAIAGKRQSSTQAQQPTEQAPLAKAA